MTYMPLLIQCFAHVAQDPNQKAFFEAFERGTSSYPERGDLSRIWGSKVILDLLPMSRSRILLSKIEALKPMQKDGSAGMAWFLSLTDAHKQVVTLSVVPTGEQDNPLHDKASLRAWYERRGFSGTGDMYRAPAVSG